MECMNCGWDSKDWKDITKDDLFEIEKVVDIYTSWVVDNLNKACQISIHYDALKKDKSSSPVVDTILSIKKTYDRMRTISKKLEQMRNNKTGGIKKQ